jgi:hypothetical protein
MADTRTDRLARVDAAIALARANRDRAEDACHSGEELFWETRVDHLVGLRNRIEPPVIVIAAGKD